jgi:hypothetical protein
MDYFIRFIFDGFIFMGEMRVVMGLDSLFIIVLFIQIL